MNSSGIKRGLAASAVSALALVGIPALATSANAAAGDTIDVVSAGPALNGGDEGAVVVLRVKDGTVTPANLKLTSTTAATVGSQNTSDQSASIVDTATSDDTTNTAYDLIRVHIKTTTSATGSTATFRVFEDEAGGTNNSLDAAEPRTNVSVATAGAVSSVQVSPAAQSTAQGIESGDYTVTLKDSAGRTTQLNTNEVVALSTDNQITLNPNTFVAGDPNAVPPVPDTGARNAGVLDSDALDTGSATFTATPAGNATLGSHSIALNGPGAADATATLTVTSAANVTAANVDIVTGADDWDGPGDGNAGGTTEVRVDQSSIRIDIKGSTPGGTVTLNVDGDRTHTGGTTDVLFGGKKSTTVSTVLDSTGSGSLTITADAGTVQEGDIVDVSGSFVQTFDFERAHADSVEATADPYFSKLGGTTSITVTAVDQFGDPLTTGFIAAYDAAGPNQGTPPGQVKPVDANGQATFSFTDTKATAVGQQDTIAFGYVPDQFSTTPTANGTATINYTTDGMGANFNTTLDTKNTEAADYDATKVALVPLADTVADNDGGSNETAELGITGAEPNSTLTASVDNGALILAPGKTALSDGKATVTVALDGTGNLPAGYTIVGTKAGVVTATISAASRTETAKFTVSPEVDKSTARNVTISGPATVENGTTQIPFTAVVTDAFGNPVANVPVTDLNIQVTGPAQFQDSDAVTNANGELNLNVRVDAGAEGDVTIKVQGFGEQFGAAADQLTSASAANSAKGLPVSSNVGTATTTVEAATAPTKDAINLVLNGHNNGKKADKLTANANGNAAGLTAVLYKGNKKVASHKLNASGNYQFTIKDTNGKKATKYTVKVAGTATTMKDQASKSVK